MLVKVEFGDVGFCGGKKTGEPREKPSEQGENQQQTQPTLTALGWNQSQARLVGRGATVPCLLPIG